MNPYQLYLVTDDQQDLNTLIRVVEGAVLGGVTMIQIREKHGDIRAFIERAQAVKKILCGTHIPLIINDRVDVALAVDADGVHLGQSDMSALHARRLLGEDKIIGLSVENEQQLIQARDLPIDYVGLSAIFPTSTKTDTKKSWGLEGLRWAREHYAKPIVAIGGLNERNILDVTQAGADGIALVSAICHADNVEAATCQLKQCLVAATTV